MTRLLVAIVAVAVCAGGASAQPHAAVSGTWAGTISFWAPAGDPVPLSVESRLCIERLDPVTRQAGRDFTYINFPRGTHGLIGTENGLLAEADRSNRLVDGLYPAIRDWLRVRGFSPAS
jgi:hypothetical protein